MSSASWVAPPISDAQVDLPSLQDDKEGCLKLMRQKGYCVDAIAATSDVDTSSSLDEETSDQADQSECDDRLKTFHPADLGAIHLHLWCCVPLCVTHLEPSRRLVVLGL